MDRKSVDLSVSVGFSVFAIMMSLCFGCNFQSSGGASTKGGIITKVPGYVVELVGTDMHGRKNSEPSCMGTHIGEGFILTAANCVFQDICNSGYSLSSLQYRTSGSAAWNSGAIEAIAYHKHVHTVSSDKTLRLSKSKHSANLSAAHDLALIKVSGDIKASAKVPSPSDSLFSSEKISGRLYVYHPHLSKAGSVGAVKISDKAALRTQMTARFKGKVESTQSIHRNPYPEEADVGKTKYGKLDARHLATAFPSCFALGTGGAIESTSAYGFSEDGSMDADPTVKAMIDQYLDASKVWDKLFFGSQRPTGDERASLINRYAESSTQYQFRFLKDALIIEAQGDHKTDFCPNHSGGPVVQRLDDDVVVGVLAAATVSTDDRGVKGVRAEADHRSTSLIESASCSSHEAASYKAVSSTYHNLSWINAVKASILAGGHSIQSNESP